MKLREIYKYQLTPKELDVLKLMHKPTMNISQELNLPFGTVKSRIDRIMEKVEAKKQNTSNC